MCIQQAQVGFGFIFGEADLLKFPYDALHPTSTDE